MPNADEDVSSFRDIKPPLLACNLEILGALISYELHVNFRKKSLDRFEMRTDQLLKLYKKKLFSETTDILNKKIYATLPHSDLSRKA